MNFPDATPLKIVAILLRRDRARIWHMEHNGALGPITTPKTSGYCRTASLRELRARFAGDKRFDLSDAAVAAAWAIYKHIPVEFVAGAGAAVPKDGNVPPKIQN